MRSTHEGIPQPESGNQRPGRKGRDGRFLEPTAGNPFPGMPSTLRYVQCHVDWIQSPIYHALADSPSMQPGWLFVLERLIAGQANDRWWKEVYEADISWLRRNHFCCRSNDQIIQFCTIISEHDDTFRFEAVGNGKRIRIYPWPTLIAEIVDLDINEVKRRLHLYCAGIAVEMHSNCICIADKVKQRREKSDPPLTEMENEKEIKNSNVFEGDKSLIAHSAHQTGSVQPSPKKVSIPDEQLTEVYRLVQERKPGGGYSDDIKSDHALIAKRIQQVGIDVVRHIAIIGSIGEAEKPIVFLYGDKGFERNRTWASEALAAAPHNSYAANISSEEAAANRQRLSAMATAFFTNRDVSSDGTPGPEVASDSAEAFGSNPSRAPPSGAIARDEGNGKNRYARCPFCSRLIRHHTDAVVVGYALYCLDCATRHSVDDAIDDLIT